MTDCLLSNLKAFYRENGIGADGEFSCVFKRDCSGNAPNIDLLPRESHVGTRYGIGVPRLVFVSLDPGSIKPGADRRIERRDAWKPGPKKWNKSRHWYRTCQIAWRVLSASNPALAGMLVEDMEPYFVHVNSARCSQNKSGNAQADFRLFANCRKFIGPELEILQPRILITQGRR